MFGKPYRIKSNSQLKGSERKKLRAEILKNFPSLTEEKLQEIVPNKEVVVQMKVQAYSGESAMIYCVQKLPIIFEIDKIMYPTVYMMWKAPDLLYSFTTWPQVLPKITGGADLMLPGVVLKDGFHVRAYGKFEKGERVAVNLTTNSATIAVGQTALSSIDMYMSARRGKCVRILHYVGDELWGYGTKLNTPELGPPIGFQNLAEEDEEVKIEENHSSQSIDRSTLPMITSGLYSLGVNDFECCTDSAEGVNANENIDVMQRVSMEAEGECGEKALMDKLVEYCFIKALNSSAKKAEYPMLSSKFYKLHMLPACPSGKSLDMKKSSYKKLSVFLNKMNVAGVVTVRELTKGVESIMQINSSHELLRNFVDEYREDSEASAGPQQMTVLDSNCRPQIEEMYVITAAVLPIFSKFDLKKGASLPVATVRKHVTDYVKQEGLQDSDNRRFVKLNDVLSSVMENKSDVTWDELFNKVLARMTRSYQMSFSGHNPVVSKGKLEPIDIQVGKRTGNKKVTLVNNLELYGINLSEFARECQHGVAASTSISSVPGKKSAQLMVQGNQVLFIANILTDKYQIPKRYLRGLENAPKTKK